MQIREQAVKTSVTKTSVTKTAKKKDPRASWRTSWLDSVQGDLAKHAAAMALIQRTLADIEFPTPIQPDAFNALVRRRMADDIKFRRAMHLAGFSEGSLFDAKTPREAGHDFVTAVKRGLSNYGDRPTKANMARAIKWLMDETGVAVRDITRIDGEADPHPGMWRDPP
jgi:hypothetical protein